MLLKIFFVDLQSKMYRTVYRPKYFIIKIFTGNPQIVKLAKIRTLTIIRLYGIMMTDELVQECQQASS